MSGNKCMIFTGDFLRINKGGHPSQRSNTLWFYNLVSPLLKLLGQPHSLSLPDNENPESLTVQFYRAASLTPSLSAWSTVYDGSCNQRQLALLEACFRTPLVIGYELPNIIIRSFDELEVPYLDFTLHPVRFMDNLIFGMRSNIPGLADVLQNWVVSEAEISLAAGVAKASMCHLPPLDYCKYPDDIAVFACQTEEDRVLIREGHLVDADDILDDLDRICSKHARVLVKPHPYASSTKTRLNLLSIFPNTMLANDNIYRLFCEPKVTTVYSISSSASIEAEYFGIKGNHIIKYPLKFSDHTLNDEVYLRLSACFLNIDFWKIILEALGLKYNDVSVPNLKVDLRRTLNMWWGAAGIFR